MFVYFPRKTLSVAKELSETVKNTLGLSPQVTINQKIISKLTNEILELAMIEQDFDVEHETSHTWMRCEKKITLCGTYRAKIGFNLQKGFNIEVHRGKLLRSGQIVLQLPHAEILSVEPLDVQKSSCSILSFSTVSLGGSYANFRSNKCGNSSFDGWTSMFRKNNTCSKA